MLSAWVNLWCWVYRLNMNCWNIPETKKICYKYYFYIHIFIDTKFYFLIYMDHKGSNSLLISSQGINWLLNESGNSYFNNRIPIDTTLTSSHGFSQKLDRNLRQKRWMWSITLPISPCSQNPWSSHYPTDILFSEWTHYTLTLRSPSYQKWCCHNNHS